MNPITEPARKAAEKLVHAGTIARTQQAFYEKQFQSAIDESVKPWREVAEELASHLPQGHALNCNLSHIYFSEQRRQEQEATGCTCKQRSVESTLAKLKTLLNQ